MSLTAVGCARVPSWPVSVRRALVRAGRMLGMLAVLLGLGVSQAAAEATQTVPASVNEVLTRLAKETPQQQVADIDAVKGVLHPLLLLARGQARYHLAHDASEAQRPALLHAASDDFTHALAVDASLRQAHLGLAQCAALSEDWKTASREVASGIDPLVADSSVMEFLASSAWHAGDWRLATLAVQEGILRFPDDQVLRHLEVSVLVHAKRTEDARQAILALLAQNPQDCELWRDLAWAAHETGREDESLSALEAALAVQPGDPALRRQLASAQLAGGMPQAAYATIMPLIGDPPRALALQDDALMQLASRAAADGGALWQARAWLQAVPEHFRTRAQRLASARYAVEAGDNADASASLDSLIAAGEHDAAILTWAGSLAENAGESARAETLYLHAIASEGKDSGSAALHLVAFYLKHARRDEAHAILGSYLVKKPTDAQALALQAQLNQLPPARKP
jgi:predicted Zn-dependent protease